MSALSRGQQTDSNSAILKQPQTFHDRLPQTPVRLFQTRRRFVAGDPLFGWVNRLKRGVDFDAVVDQSDSLGLLDLIDCRFLRVSQPGFPTEVGEYTPVFRLVKAWR